MNSKMNYKKGLALLLTGAMVIGAVGTYQIPATKIQAAKSAETVEITRNQEEPQIAKTSAEEGRNKKEETVYVIADGEGNVNKVIVSNWIQNTRGDASVQDTSDLTDITVTKGEAEYTLNDNNMLTWDTKGEDVYYQGTSTADLPVAVKAQYLLDGAPITPGELEGKTGTLTIRLTYENQEKKNVVIQGKTEEMYVPFIMISGAVLENAHYSNVTVTNGKVISDGDRSMVMGFALPGLNESLKTDGEKVNFPETVEITADVTQATVPTLMTLADTAVFAGEDQAFQSIASQLKDGSSDLYETVGDMLSDLSDLTQGVEELKTGGKSLQDGAGELATGSAELMKGLQSLASGLSKLNENSAALNDGARQVFMTMLGTADTQLKAAGLNLPALTPENYQEVLGQVIQSATPEGVQKLAYATALKTVTAQVKAQESVITEKVTEGVKAAVLAEVLKGAGMEMDPATYQGAVAAGQVPPEAAGQIQGALEKQMASKEVQGKISALVKEQEEALIQENMKSDAVTAQINAAVEQAKASGAADTLTALVAQLDSYNQFYTGLLTYTKGVDTAYAGAVTLSGGSKKLNDGAKELADGAKELYQGLSKLAEGTETLEDACGGDLDALRERLTMVRQLAREYRSFTGESKTMDSKVKFIYKMEK